VLLEERRDLRAIALLSMNRRVAGTGENMVVETRATLDQGISLEDGSHASAPGSAGLRDASGRGAGDHDLTVRPVVTPLMI